MISSKTRIRGVLAALVLATLLAFSPATGPGAAFGAPVAPDASKSALLSIQNAFTSIADQVEPSVVYIETERKTQVQSNDPFDQFFRGWPFGGPGRGSRPQTQTEVARGSGVIVRSDGYILTNDHVVGGADRVTVTLSDKREFTGKVFRDQTTDLALVKIEAKNLPAAVLGDSDKIKPGQWAIAIGNPGGEFTNTLTVGVVSAVTRDFKVPDQESPNGFRSYPDAIQTDAAINPGNSGGPLLDIDGHVIGVNAAIWSPTGGSVGIGFAIPANRAKFVMDQLISTGKVIRGRLGVAIDDLSGDQAAYYGVSTGALVQSVEDGASAKKAGVEVEDVIVEFAGQKVASAASLIRLVEKTAPGTKTTMVVLRDKKRVPLNVTIGETPGETASEADAKTGDTGLTVTDLTADIARQLRLETSIKGVAVEDVDEGSPADRAGIAAGDIITKINGKPVTSVADYNRAMGLLKSGDRAMMVLYRVAQGKGQTRIAALRLD